jgi:hypothetical protein
MTLDTIKLLPENRCEFDDEGVPNATVPKLKAIADLLRTDTRGVRFKETWQAYPKEDQSNGLFDPPCAFLSGLYGKYKCRVDLSCWGWLCVDAMVSGDVTSYDAMLDITKSPEDLALEIRLLLPTEPDRPN